jgi:hypothetical protein
MNVVYWSLGDMRSYNFVIIPIYDFDQLVYKIRATSLTNNVTKEVLNYTKPHLFKENFIYNQLVKKLNQMPLNNTKKEEVRS